ncbi:MAG: 30S ribosome-binding factor RbfA [Phycisphaerales bacterium]|nr:30S ribosome-binding factor RbfA [Phycisphaerales bacterium]
MSRRTEQVRAALERAVQEALARKIADPRISGLITVTGVRLSGDETTATVRVSVLPVEKQDLTLHGLNHAAEHIRREVGGRIVIRRMPRLVFELDANLKKEAETLAAIARIAQEREASPTTPDEPPPAADRPGASEPSR